MNNDQVLSLALLGYDITKSSDAIDLGKLKINNEKIMLDDYDYLINESYNLLLSAVKPFVGIEKLLVPLSGGMDSRAILMAISTFRNLNTVYTYTYGKPGTYDFNYGNLIARKLNTIHTSFPINVKNISTISLEKNLEFIKNVSDLLFIPPLSEIEKKFNGFTVISGFMGGEITGSQLKKEYYNDLSLTEAKVLFLNKNLIHNESLSKYKDLAISKLLNYVDFQHSNLSFYETIEILNRRNKYSYFVFNNTGFVNKYPFLDENLMNFYLSLPPKMRFDQKLYKDMLITKFPEAFKLAIKNLNGGNLESKKLTLHIRKIIYKIFYKTLNLDPMVNYFKTKDMNEELLDFLNKINSIDGFNEINKIIDWQKIISKNKDRSDLIRFNSNIHILNTIIKNDFSD